jgi:beta-glucosidase
MMRFTRKDFPDGFLFGAATSAYQIEGHQFGGAGETHWDTFSRQPGKVERQENGALACDHYHRYPEDFALLQDAGFDSYRFSTSWARVMPDGRTVNMQGLDFYDRLVDSMLEHQLKPAATLYHWELPVALAEQGGWCNRDIADWFTNFTEVIMGRIGDRMFSVAPINEPWCVSWLSHYLGHHAPGLCDIGAAAHAMHHVLLAHGSAISTMRSLGMTNLGGVFNMEYANPADDSPESARAASLYDGIFNRFFLSGVLRGEYPSDVLEGLEPHLPAGWQKDLDCISAPLDWVGINYYTRKNIKFDNTPWPSLSEINGPLPKTAMDWEIYPEGLAYFLRRTHREYSKGLPIYITENGMASYSGLNDLDRIEYLDDHLDAALHAIDEGIPLAGYFFWSLLDNYEWSKGYDPQFGLVHVDFNSLDRTPKSSYQAIKAAIKK